jgi:hypothetical protein
MALAQGPALMPRGAEGVKASLLFAPKKAKGRAKNQKPKSQIAK